MSEFLNDLSLAELTAPINEGSGEDLSFSTLFDQVKEARRADPDYLTQGDWQTDLKSSDWDLTLTLAAQGLARQSSGAQAPFPRYHLRPDPGRTHTGQFLDRPLPVPRGWGR
jgi:hypothetical protein